jgi:hypothetical protein
MASLGLVAVSVRVSGRRGGRKRARRRLASQRREKCLLSRPSELHLEDRRSPTPLAQPRHRCTSGFLVAVLFTRARARDRVACRISPAPPPPQTPLPTAETAKTLRPRLFRSCSEAPQTPRRAPETPKTLSLFLRCSEPPQTPPPTGRTRKTRSPQTRPRASRRSRRHSSFATTRTYLHLAGTVFREEAERMERLALGGSSTEPSTDLSESQDTSADLTTAEQAEAPSV